MGFGDAACLSEMINKALFHGEDIGKSASLSSTYFISVRLGKTNTII